MLSLGDGEMKVLNTGKYKDISTMKRMLLWTQDATWKKSREDYDKQSIMI